MKKLFLTLLIVVLSFSCDNNTVTISKDEYGRLIGDTMSLKYPKPFKLFDEKLTPSNPDGIVLGSDNHEYLILNNYSHSRVVTHYVDCEYCIKQQSFDLPAPYNNN